MFAGIDVGAEERVAVLRKAGTAEAAPSFRNTAFDHARLVRLLAKDPVIALCQEATGTCSMERAIALPDAGLRLMVVNPQASHNFARVLGKHGKTDQVDAGAFIETHEDLKPSHANRLRRHATAASGPPRHTPVQHAFDGICFYVMPELAAPPPA